MVVKRVCEELEKDEAVCDSVTNRLRHYCSAKREKGQEIHEANRRHYIA